MAMALPSGMYSQTQFRPPKPSAGGNNTHFCSQAGRIERLEDGLLSLTKDVAEVRQTIGKAPNPVTGTPGDGMAEVLYRVANHIMLGHSRGAVESLMDDVDEGEITKVQTRQDLLIRAKTAEAKLAEKAEQSDHVRSERNEKRRVVAAVLGAALGGGGLVGLAQLVASLIGG